MESFLEAMGEEISDPEEGKSLHSSNNQSHWLSILIESFLLFSQSIPSQNLGFVDSKATVLQLTINDRDLTIHQSPTILSSNRGGGTTGAGKKLLWTISSRLMLASCLEDYSSLRILDHFSRKSTVQTRPSGFEVQCSRVGMWDIWNHRSIACSTHQLICLDRPGICVEVAEPKSGRKSK